MRIEDLIKNDQNEMGEITHQIIKIRTTPDYVMISFPDEKIMISIDAYFHYGLAGKQGIDDRLYEILKQDEIELKAYRGALRKLSARDHTIAQIRSFLAKYDLSKDKINGIIDRLISYNLLNDDKYALNKINALDNEQCSFSKIKVKLRKDGLAEELIDKYLHYDQDREDEKAEVLARHHARTVHGKSKKAALQHIVSRLVADGFSYETARNAVLSLEIDDHNELELLRKEYRKAYRKYSRKYADYELKQRITGALMAKGFAYDDIRTVTEEENGQEG